ncbi:MAG: cobalt ECF transporter T component CbiQ [FCB group bacterium]|jgi:cobalt/nickel transport system permease protein|nr:cobalt ECF transporter T component CbiQ [FCB group bacterium]
MSAPLAGSPSFLHGLDARAKLLALLALLLGAVTTPQGAWGVFLGYASIVIGLVFWARMPLRTLALRYGALASVAVLASFLIPFLHRPESADDLLFQAGVLRVSRSGLTLFGTVFSKASMGILCALVLRETTPFPELLTGLERLRVPRTLVALTAMTYRYLFVLADEALRLRRARDSRCYGGRWLWQAKVVGQMIGSLFVRAHDRAERVYGAMVSRGFTGELPGGGAVSLRRRDYAFFGTALVVSVMLRMPW